MAPLITKMLTELEIRTAITGMVFGGNETGMVPLITKMVTKPEIRTTITSTHVNGFVLHLQRTFFRVGRTFFKCTPTC